MLNTRAKCYVINAPKWATFGWTIVRSVLNDRTRDKVTISTGIPDALTQALGGEEALQAMCDSVPPVLPVPMPEASDEGSIPVDDVHPITT